VAGAISWLDLGLIYAAAIWGSTFIVVKAVLPDIHPFTLVGYRFLISAACMLPFVLRRKEPWALLKEGMVLGSLLVVLYVSQTAGLQYTTASNSGFITGLFVLFVPLFMLLFLGQSPRRTQWLAVALALAGLWLLTGGVYGFNRGDSLTLLAAVTYAGHILATDRYVRADADPVLLAFHQFWFCGAMSLAMAFAAGASFRIGSAQAFWIVLFLALFPNLSAFYIQILAQKHASPVKVSLIFSLEPVFAAVFAWTLGGEPFFLANALGGGLILAGMVLGELGRHRRASGTEVLPT